MRGGCPWRHPDVPAETARHPSLGWGPINQVRRLCLKVSHIDIVLTDSGVSTSVAMSQSISANADPSLCWNGQYLFEDDPDDPAHYSKAAQEAQRAVSVFRLVSRSERTHQYAHRNGRNSWIIAVPGRSCPGSWWPGTARSLRCTTMASLSLTTTCSNTQSATT